MDKNTIQLLINYANKQGRNKGVNMSNIDLIKIARDMQKRAYSPYSKYKVGAALLCKDGSIITGCNIENISYGGTICAERTAIFKAISEGKREFSEIVISVSGSKLSTPCGICLQVLSEFVGEDFKVTCSNKIGKYKTYKFSELYPIPFNFQKIISDDI